MQFGKTALHYACANGHGLIARVLVLYGADPKMVSQGGLHLMRSSKIWVTPMVLDASTCMPMPGPIVPQIRASVSRAITLRPSSCHILQRDASNRTAFDDANDNNHASVIEDLLSKLPGVALPCKPTSPVLFKADSTTLVVSWDPAPSPSSSLPANGNSGKADEAPSPSSLPSAYKLQVTTASGNPALRRWTIVAADIQGTTQKVRGLAPATSYITRVAAQNSYGWGDYSEVSDVMTTASASGSSSALASSSSSTPNPTGSAGAASGGPTQIAVVMATLGLSSASLHSDHSNASSASDNSINNSNGNSGSAPIMFWGPLAAGSGAAAVPRRTPSPSPHLASNGSKHSSALSSPAPPDFSSPEGGGSRSKSAARSIHRISSHRSSGGGYSDDVDDEGSNALQGSSSSSAATSATGRPPLSSTPSRPTNPHSQARSMSKKFHSSDAGSSSDWKDDDSSHAAGHHGDASELRDLLRTLQLDLEEEQARRRIIESELSRYTASASALSSMSVDDLTALEKTLEESLKSARAAKEKRMKEALGDEMSRTMCSVCLSKPKTILFLPCKHLCACSECANRIMKPVPDNKGARKEPACPICRVAVREVLDVYA